MTLDDFIAQNGLTFDPRSTMALGNDQRAYTDPSGRLWWLSPTQDGYTFHPAGETLADGAAVQMFDQQGNATEMQAYDSGRSPWYSPITSAFTDPAFLMLAGGIGAGMGGLGAAGAAAGAPESGMFMLGADAAPAALAGDATAAGYAGMSAPAAATLGGGASVAGGSALPAAAAGAAGAAAGGFAWDKILTAAAPSVLGAVVGSNAASRAAGAQTAAAQAGIGEIGRQFDALQKLLQPYVQAGTQGLAGYQALSGAGGAQAQQGAIDALQSSPAYSSLVRSGEQAILQNAAATGGLRGGNVQNSLAVNRENILAALIDKQLGQFGTLAQMGQNSAAGVGSAGMATGGNIANLLQQSGAAQAGGTIAGANAINNAAGTIGGLIASQYGITPPTQAAPGVGGKF